MGPWRSWVALLGRTEPGTALALFRGGVGLSVLHTLGTAASTGAMDLYWVDRAHGGYRSLGELPWLVSALGGATAPVVHGLVALSGIGAVLLVLGLGARLGALLALQGLLALTWLNGHAGGSYDDLLSNALWLLVLARSDRTLSLGCRLRTGAWRSAAPVSSWPRWLAAFQLLVMYSSTVSQKLSTHWLPGGDLSALYFILQQPTWQRVDMRWVAGVYPLTQAATLAVWLWELSAPLVLMWLWARRTKDRGGRWRVALLRWDLRLPFLALGLAMHLGTALALEVGPFSWISLSFYPCLWRGGELDAAWEGLRRRASGARRGPGPASPPGG